MSMFRTARAPAFVASLIAAVLAAACGGGDNAAGSASGQADAGARKRAMAVDPARWVTVPTVADPLLGGLNIPADAPARGMWGAVQSWPLNALHAALLPNGKLLTYGTNLDGGAQNGRYLDVWDPTLGFGANSHVTTFRADQQDSFCSTATFLTDGRLLITGGNGSVTSTLYTPSTNSVSQLGANLADQRWYATMLTLPDGRPLILGGMVPYAEGMQDNPSTAITQGLASMTPEVYENGAWRSLPGGFSRDAFGPDYLRASYPRAWVAPSGRVFGVSAERMWTFDPAGNGTMTIHGAFKSAPSATTRPNVGATNSAVMYDIGKVLIMGGNGGFNGDGLPASNMATAIDINGAAPVLTEQPPMATARRFPNAIALPDGRVLVTGGTTLGNNNGANAVFASEIWNPATGTWSTGASAAIFRGYHSFTVLLPNGTVLSTGGGTPGPVTNLNAEVYYPPQLFRSVNGVAQLAPRPVMTAISGLSYAHGGELQIDMSNAAAISRLVLIGLGNGTHSFNSGQRRIPLTFTQDTIRLSTTIPSANLVPPGYYQVVAVDAAGVPSRGTIIAIGQGVSAPPVTTTPYNPPDLSAPISAPIINAGGTASYTVGAVAGTSYSWDFGDGTAATAFSPTASITKVFANAGLYNVTLTARATDGSISRRNFVQAVATAKTARSPNASSAMALEIRAAASARLWVVNPDGDSVAVIDTATRSRTAEIALPAGASPRSVAVAPDGRLWIVNKGTASISIVSPSTLAVVQTITLARGSQPHGLAFAPGGGSAFVVLEATGQLIKLDPATGAQQGIVAVGANPRHVAITADAVTALVSRFITPPLPGESTATIDTSTAGAEVVAVNAGPMTINRTVVLRHSDKTDTEIQGAGIPNYLGAAVISPDGTGAWVPSKQDNVKRGTRRNGQNLNFQNTVRAISSRITMATLAEDLARRIDHDNASLASAGVFHPSGVYLFVALETSRQVAVVNAVGGGELFRIETGVAPQGLALSADGSTLFVQNFMDRSVGIVDLTPLTARGELRSVAAATVGTVGAEKLAANVLQGKKLFYDARDPRLSRDSYMSCASCHNDGGHDGRTWDLSGFGEGLRNTIALRGRAAMGHGFLHWSANFNELQDFEGQIRALAGGTGLMSDAQFNTGTRSAPLGDAKAGVSADLDALAAYVASLSQFDLSPLRNADGTLSASAAAGRTVFQNAGCASCHGGSNFTISGDAGTLRNIGTIKATSGTRLNGTLSGIDVPTLRDVWATAPYLHDGSAPTLAAAVQAHQGNTVAGTDLANLVAYLQQIGREEGGGLAGSWSFNEGAGATAADASGGNRTMTLANTAWVAGRVGTALQFNGATSSGSTAGPVVDTAQSFTVAAWVRLDALTGWRTFVNQDGVNISGFWLQYSEFVGNKFLLSMHDADSTASNAVRAVGTTTPVVGQWYHVVGVRDKAAGTMKLYVNGRLEGTTAYAGGWASNGPLNVGRGRFGGPGDWFAGGIDEVRAFGSALSDAEVAQLFGQSAPANVAPTVSLTAPANNASVPQGTAVAITASAADSDGSIARVEFFDGATLLGTVTAAPYTFIWTNAPAGVRTITARATDNAGAATTSAAVTLTVLATTTPPANAVACVNEGATCTLPANSTASVWYGGGTAWFVRTGVTGSIACTNATFGDPAPGLAKACRYLVTSTTTPTVTNIAPTATLATSYVSPWETLAAVNNNITPASSADKNGGAYGNWNGTGAYGATNWVSFTWSTARTLSAFEVYWWNDGQGIATPTAATVQYWNGSAWVNVAAIGRSLNTFNRLSFAPITTTRIRVSMSSTRATGILEARVFGY